MQSERQSTAPIDDEMDETVETVDEYALEPADSKKASAVPMSISDRLGVELKKFEEARVNDIYFTSKYFIENNSVSSNTMVTIADIHRQSYDFIYIKSFHNHRDIPVSRQITKKKICHNSLNAPTY